MAQVRCEVTPGLRESERTVAVKDVHGQRQFLRVEEGFLSRSGEEAFLPVGIVGVDEAKNLALVELPHESDAGVNRLWVHMDDIRGLKEPVA